MSILIYPKFKAWASDESALSGGKVYTYEIGTTTAKAAYSDSDLTTPHTNPIILDSDGEAEIYLNGGYRIVITDSSDVQIDDIDSVYGAASQSFLDLSDTPTSYTANYLLAVNGAGTAITQVAKSILSMTDTPSSFTASAKKFCRVNSGSTAVEFDYVDVIQDDDTDTKIQVEETADEDIIRVDIGGTEQLTIQDGSILPTTDDDIDLGSATKEFKDGYFDGTVTTDALVADTADINAGTIDGTNIGSSTKGTGEFSSLALNTGSTVTDIFDEDDMVSDSNTALVTQQSAKAYANSRISDTAYGAGWNGVTTIGASKNAIYDIVSTLGVGDMLYSATRSKAFYSTIDVSSASDKSITGIGFTPTAVIVWIAESGGEDWSLGFYSGVGSDNCFFYQGVASTIRYASDLIVYNPDNTNYRYYEIKSLDADGITIQTRTSGGSPSGTLGMGGVCFR